MEEILHELRLVVYRIIYKVLFFPGAGFLRSTISPWGFYTADIFAPEPTQQRDVLPVLRLLEDVKPDVTWQKFGGKDPWDDDMSRF